MKFQRLLTPGYIVEHNGFVIVVKKQSDGRWLAETKRREGIKLVDETNYALHYYSRKQSRKSATQRVVDCLNEDYPSGCPVTN